jgi:hypothetical protein
MEKLHEIAIFCVGRAVMFGSLAIFCVMFSFAFQPAWAFRAGAIMTLGMAGILVIKASLATTQRPRKTEVWMYLDEKSRPANDHADRYFASVMRDVYGRFAKASLAVACGMFVLSLAFSALDLQFA